MVALVALVSVSAGGAVREVRSKAEFDKIIAHNALTGMPVVVDFFSDSCGPCRMIAPVYVQIANQNKKDAVFLKVNVQMANVGVEIRSMPTFQFYAKGKKVHEFSGADEGGIRRSVGQLVSKSKKGKKVLEVTSKAQFKKILRDAGKLPVVAGFFSKADDDCKKIYPKFKELAKEYHRKTVFIKVDVDTVAEIKEVANVDTVPTFHVYKGGKKLQEVTGADEQGLHKAVNDEAESGGDDDEDEDEGGGGGGEKKARKPKRPKKIARRPKSNLCEKVIILGGGPAGLSAAIYAARAGLHPIVLAPKVGGQLSSTKEVENYPGMIESEGGIILSEMHEQALLYDAGFEEDLAVEVDLTTRPFKIKTNSSTFMTRTIIVATGADSRWLGVKGEDQYKTQGVSSCATCDGFLFKGKPVVVVGGGDTAMEDSLVLARTSSNVTLIHRRDSFRASKILQERVLTNPKITVLWNSEVKEFYGEKDRLAKVVVNNRNTNEETNIEVDGAFVAIGHDPNTNLPGLKGVLTMDENGYLETQGKSTYTNVEGVFACGDVMDHVYRQAVTSAGTGAMAALDAERWISANGFDKEEQPILDALPEGFEKWRVKLMKEAMKERKISAKGCVEKPDYVKKLQKWQKKFLKKQKEAAANIEVGADGSQCKDPPCGTAQQ